MRGWRVATIGGIPIELHYSLPFGFLVFGGPHFRPTFWAIALFIVLFHELGHAVVVRSQRLRVSRIVIHGLGGVCYWNGQASAIASSRIAWGGVVAQLLLLAPMLAVLKMWPDVRSSLPNDVEYALVHWNATVIALNLVPVHPLDGAEAWPLFGLLIDRWQLPKRDDAAAREAKTKALMRKLDEVDEQPITTEIQGVVSDLFARVKKKDESQR
jgi:Zn-dependent protease